MSNRRQMHISSEDIKAILVENGFEPHGDRLIMRGPTEFLATVAANRVDLSYTNGPSVGEYTLEAFSPEFASMLNHIFADVRAKAFAALRHHRS